MGNVQVQAAGKISLSAKLTYCCTSAASRSVFPRSCSLATNERMTCETVYSVFSFCLGAYRSKLWRYSPQSGYRRQFQMLEPGTFETAELPLLPAHCEYSIRKTNLP